MRKLIPIVLLVIAGNANAQSTINVSAGDLVLGFFLTTGAGQNVEVDLGNAENFITATPGQVINLSGPAGLSVSDLFYTYGPNWASNPDLKWGVIAGNIATPIAGAIADSIWATDPELTPGTPSTPWTTNNASTQAGGSQLGVKTEQVLNGKTSTAKPQRRTAQRRRSFPSCLTAVTTETISPVSILALTIFRAISRSTTP